MDSLFAPVSARDGETILLPPEEAHHALRVRRLRAHEEVAVVDGEGGWYRCVADGAGPGERGERGGRSAPTLRVRILEERREMGEPGWHLTLAQAVGKGRKFELVVEKGTELGASAFIPLSTDREIVPLRSAGVLARTERWRRIALAAMKQCGRSRLPEVEPPRSLAELAERFPDYDLVMVAWEEERATGIAAALRAKIFPAGRAPRILVMVGPEGGFTAEEIRAVTAAGAVSVTLGERRLRTETAGLVVAALVGGILEGSPERAAIAVPR